MDANGEFLQGAYKRIRASVATSAATSSTTAATDAQPSAPVLPQPAQIAAARVSLPQPKQGGYLAGRGREATLDHLLKDIAPALNGQNLSGRYYGFVTGSTLPIAEVADNLVTAYDQNVMVHLPTQTIASEVEDAALKMLISLLRLGGAADWEGRTLTTGATSSNILGLGCGREAVIQARLPNGAATDSVGELGLLAACAKAGVSNVQVLTSMGHSSLYKAASVVGLGRGSVKELPYSEAEPWRLNIDAVEKELQREGVASIIAVSAGEVNTGRFATTGLHDMRRLREMADRYGAWIHVDGAFGMFARCLPATPEFAGLRDVTAGYELADSITLDGHKLLNVPYDCGVFLTRKVSVLTGMCQNPNAAYLSSGSAADGIQSPQSIGLQNSRRFRALPVYAVLLSEGRDAMAEILARMVRLARGVAEIVKASPDYVLLPSEDAAVEDHHVIVLFRARDDALNQRLAATIQETGEWYVGGTAWNGQPAVRVAVSSWRVNVEEDLPAIARFLASMAEAHRINGTQ